jgi:sec-independent protein translocase protein TatB
MDWIVSAPRVQVSLHFMGTPLPVQLDILGWTDSLILMVLALVVFGPRRLPQIGRQIGKLMYEFRKASNEFKFQMEEELRSAEEADRRKREEERLKALKSPAAEMSSLTPVTSPGSPYSEDVVYPHGSPAAAPVAEAPRAAQGQSPSPEAQTEESSPRILPPSTGEQIPAARPTAAAAQFEYHPESASRNGLANGAERDQIVPEQSADAAQAVPQPSDESRAGTEQAAHHG